MPKISIYEQDISAVDTTNILENVVFIPGIASQGEIGVAKYFNNIADFKKEYGDNPVQFTEAQNYPTEIGTGVFAPANSYEPSFIYACELLNAGLPIIFERLPQTVATAEEITFSEDTPFKSNEYYTRSGESEPYTYTLASVEVSDTTYYKATSYNSNIVSDVYKALKNIVFAKDTTTQKYELADKDKYNIKFITSGSYPVLEYKETDTPTIMKAMLELAATRGDCIALVDHKREVTDIITGVYNIVNAYITSTSKTAYDVTTNQLGTGMESSLNYGAILTPWGTYSNKLTYSDVSEIDMPGSFGYLLSLAQSTTNYPDWYAVAGVVRGLVPNLIQLKTIVTGAVADHVQTINNKVSINPITYINPYGNCIWANRTMHFNDKADLVASSFLNIRMLANDVKKQVYVAAKELMFETDSAQLWLDFKAKVTPLLDKMVTGNGLSRYEIKRVATDKKATIKIVITLYCLEAVENFDVTLNITNNVVELA